MDLDKLRKFLTALGLQHLNMPNLKGRRSGKDEEVWISESDEEFDFRTVEEADDGYKGSDRRNEPELDPTEQQEGENELETVDLVDKSDSDETGLVKSKWTRRQPKPTPKRRNRRGEGRQC